MRDFQHRFRQNLAVRDDNDEVGLGRPQGIDGGWLANLQGLLGGKTETLRHDLHRRWGGFEVATFWAVGLRDDGDDLLAGQLRHGLEALAGEFGCSHESDAHTLSMSAVAEPAVELKCASKAKRAATRVPARFVPINPAFVVTERANARC